MDLREKPGKVQKFLELMLRFRLIFVVLMVVLTVTLLAKDWQAVNTLPIAASEGMGMWLANLDGVGAFWNSAQYLCVAAIAMFVLSFVFGGIRGGLGSVVAAVALIASLGFLDGAEGMQLPFYGAFAGVALLLLLFAKWSVACALFPFALSWALMTGFVAWLPLIPGNAWLVWAVLSVVGFANVVAFALVAGKELSEGSPQAGALVKAGKKMFLPVCVSSLLSLAAVTVDMGNASGKEIAGAVILWVAFAIWFFGFTFGTMAFCPWERLRAGSRRVQLKDKKKTSKK
ncbi:MULTISPECIES: hypothetical protein [unclassified Fibrobacter]|uniref:hypothetical protein n=1 Tax=unclassified Fibrobacter TaxID=2634177 RepID=UPI001563E001|nr:MULTISPECIES: hypothetical protein [unclassified Fibrobacter]